MAQNLPVWETNSLLQGTGRLVSSQRWFVEHQSHGNSCKKGSWLSDCGRGAQIPNIKCCKASKKQNISTIPLPTPGHRVLFICRILWHLKEWKIPLENTRPESCYLVFTEWSLERIKLLSEAESPLSVKELETTFVKYFHMLSMKNLDKWRFKVLKIINPLLFCTLMLITLPFELTAFSSYCVMVGLYFWILDVHAGTSLIWFKR